MPSSVAECFWKVRMRGRLWPQKRSREWPRSARNLALTSTLVTRPMIQFPQTHRAASDFPRLKQAGQRSYVTDIRARNRAQSRAYSSPTNVPSPQQPWKAPVAEWVRDLYAKRQRRSEQRRQRRERAQEARVDLTNADPSVATPTTPADI